MGEFGVGENIGFIVLNAVADGVSFAVRDAGFAEHHEQRRFMINCFAADNTKY